MGRIPTHSVENGLREKRPPHAGQQGGKVDPAENNY
jgi:hypothetical protein